MQHLQLIIKKYYLKKLLNYRGHGFGSTVKHLSDFLCALVAMREQSPSH